MIIKGILPASDKPSRVIASGAAADRGSLFFRATAITASTAMALALALAPATAQDFIIDGTFGVLTPGGATNGDFGDNELDGDGNSVLVTEGSSIDVTATPLANAIQVRGDNVAVEVRGTLATRATTPGTPAPDSNGIYVVGDGVTVLLTETGLITTDGHISAYGQFIDGDFGTVTNNGTIMTSGDDGDAQRISGLGGTIINTGLIWTEGLVADGQRVNGDGASVTNSGSIRTLGSSSHGQFVFLGDFGTITNTGTISTAGDNAFAQYIDGANGTMINRGTLTTGGDSAGGMVSASLGGTIINSGSILTTGTNADGIVAGAGDNVLTNTGRVVSLNDAAIRVFGGGNEVNLQAPGFLGGDIIFEDNLNNTVVVTTGPSQSNFWTIEGDPAFFSGGAPSFLGPVPVFYDPVAQTVATFDPTLLASEMAALGDLTGLLSGVGLGAIDGFGAGFGMGFGQGFNPLGFMPVDQTSADTVSHRVGRVWATALGGQMDRDGGAATLDSTADFYGFAAGYTWQQAPDLVLNAMAGYLAGTSEADAVWAPSFDHGTHTLFVGLHGEQDHGWGRFGEGTVRFGLTAGYVAVDHNRFVNDNLAPLGESWVSADYGGFFLSPEIGLATDIALSDGTVLVPHAGLRYAAQWLGGYTETGAFSPAANATVEDRFIGTLEAEIGLDATRSFAFDSAMGPLIGSVTGRIGYLGRWSIGDDGASITLNGLTQTVASGTQDLHAATIGATLRTQITETAFLELDASYLHGDTANGLSGRISFGASF
jgi:hypothetical protein